MIRQSGGKRYVLAKFDIIVEIKCVSAYVSENDLFI